MNKRRFFLVVFSFLAACLEIIAAEPLVKFPKGDARWTVTFRYPEKKSADVEEESTRITKAQITRKDGVRRDQIWWSNSKVTEVWLLESAELRIFENPRNGGIYVIPFDNKIMTDFIPHNFDESLFSWVGPEYEGGVEKYRDQECRVFAGLISQVLHIPGFVKPEQVPPRSFKAWIDAENRQPVALDNDAAIYDFTFEPEPVEPLQMPEAFRVELDRYLAALLPSKRIERLRARNARPRG